MAFQTGTATNAENLLALFRTFITSHADLLDPAGDSSLPSQAWTELEYSTSVDSPSGSTRYELYLRGPGLANTDQIFVNINLFNDTAASTDAWTWANWGATGYDNSLPINSQPGVPPSSRTMPLFNASMPYWFFANGRRFIIIAQVTASIYVNCYCGFLLPFSPSISALEYTYPLYIGSSGGRTGVRFSTVAQFEWSGFWDPAYSAGNGSGYIFAPNNLWYSIRNWGTNARNTTASVNTVTVAIEPYTGITFSSFSILPLHVDNLEPALGVNNYVLTDCTLVQPNYSINHRDRFGILDGVAHISGVNQSSQNTVSVSSETWYVFQAHERTGQSDYIAIKE